VRKNLRKPTRRPRENYGFPDSQGGRKKCIQNEQGVNRWGSHFSFCKRKKRVQGEGAEMGKGGSTSSTQKAFFEFRDKGDLRDSTKREKGRVALAGAVELGGEPAESESLEDGSRGGKCSRGN